jgi:hypothetical protein
MVSGLPDLEPNRILCNAYCCIKTHNPLDEPVCALVRVRVQVRVRVRVLVRARLRETACACVRVCALDWGYLPRNWSISALQLARIHTLHPVSCREW